MNLVKLQDTKSTYKNQLHVCRLVMNTQKEKLRKKSHLQVHQKKKKRIKYLEINLTKEVKRPVH